MDAASLSFELFATCVKVYMILLEASDMPKTSRYLHVRLQMEQDKLVDWAVLANLTEDDNTLKPGFRLNKHLVNDALQEIKVVLLELAKLSERHNLEPTQLDPEDEKVEDTVDLPSEKAKSILQKKAISFANKTRKFPGRVRWASFDKKEFETHVSKLTALNANMAYFFEKHQRELHFQMQQNSYMEILQANNKLDDLLVLMASLTTDSLMGDRSRTDFVDRPAHEKQLLLLTRFKALNVAIESKTGNGNNADVMFYLGGQSTTENSLITISELSVLEDDDEEEDQPFRSLGSYRGKPVWIEWRYYEPIGEIDEPSPYIRDRISKLATLLRDSQKPEEFRVPDCLGYVHQQVDCRFGFVFQSQAPGWDGLPLTLLYLLCSTRKPSLTRRLQIARAITTSIWSLHATNWLHKGLRSENIVFQIETIGQPLPESGPYLAGFDYSRPADLNEVTERPTENRLHDLYRHPSTQFDIPREGRKGFKKLYDIYSLGVVLFEIGLWKPVQSIVGIKPNERIRSETVKDVQMRLLDKESLKFLEAEVGSLFTAVVTSCLTGDFGTDDDAQLQTEFGERVIRKLDSINV